MSILNAIEIPSSIVYIMSQYHLSLFKIYLQVQTGLLVKPFPNIYHAV